jgi:putative oxidoreductase
MKKNVDLGARYLLGLAFLIFGSNGLMMIFTGSGFLPMPPPSDEMMAIMGGFFGAKYLMPLVKSLQVISALFLLSNKYVNLAITFLGPILINILGIHMFVDPAGLPVAILLVVLWSILLCNRWHDFKVLVKA